MNYPGVSQRRDARSAEYSNCRDLCICVCYLFCVQKQESLIPLGEERDVSGRGRSLKKSSYRLVSLCAGVSRGRSRKKGRGGCVCGVRAVCILETRAVL